jgi:hypothetical protein
MSDAWIFLSVGDAGGDTDWVALDEVIGAADSNNHAIPTIEELAQSVSNLIAAGLVEARAVQLRLTQAGLEAFREANHTRHGHIRRFLDLEKAWRARDFPTSAPKSWSVDPDLYDQAFAAYHARFKRWFEGFKEEREGNRE